MIIYAPVKETNGVYCTVRFSDGVGKTDNPHLIDWFREHGYKVVGEAPATEQPTVEIKSDEDKPNLDFLDDMCANEIRDWAKDNGYGSVIKNTRNKEKLLKAIKG